MSTNKSPEEYRGLQANRSHAHVSAEMARADLLARQGWMVGKADTSRSGLRRSWRCLRRNKSRLADVNLIERH
jgi:hypothetical protein